jgi:hypothetical protein
VPARAAPPRAAAVPDTACPGALFAAVALPARGGPLLAIPVPPLPGALLATSAQLGFFGCWHVGTGVPLPWLHADAEPSSRVRDAGPVASLLPADLRPAAAAAAVGAVALPRAVGGAGTPLLLEPSAAAGACAVVPPRAGGSCGFHSARGSCVLLMAGCCGAGLGMGDSGASAARWAAGRLNSPCNG